MRSERIRQYSPLLNPEPEVLEERGFVSTIRMLPVQEVLNNLRAVHTERTDPGKLARGQVLRLLRATVPSAPVGIAVKCYSNAANTCSRIVQGRYRLHAQKRFP
jgi:hypothetical protein